MESGNVQNTNQISYKEIIVSVIPIMQVTRTNYIITNLHAGNKYQFRVSALNPAGAGQPREVLYIVKPCGKHAHFA